jgi:hypothetical protein
MKEAIRDKKKSTQNDLFAKNAETNKQKMAEMF